MYLRHFRILSFLLSLAYAMTWHPVFAYLIMRVHACVHVYCIFINVVLLLYLFIVCIPFYHTLLIIIFSFFPPSNLYFFLFNCFASSGNRKIFCLNIYTESKATTTITTTTTRKILSKNHVHRYTKYASLIPDENTKTLWFTHHL